MKIGIVGTGRAARALGILLAAQRHELFFGASEPAAAGEAAASAGRGARAGGVDDAVRFGDVLLYTLRSGRPPAPDAGAAGVNAKIVVDLGARPERGDGAAPRPAVGARFVRAFYELPQEAFDVADAVPLCEYGATLYLYGEAAAAKAVAASLGESLGFAPVDCGPLDNARVVGALGDAIRLLADRGSQALAPRVTPARWRVAA